MKTTGRRPAKKRVRTRRPVNLAPSSIEMTIRKALSKLGVKWRGGLCVSGFYPDLYLPEYHALVEVNGCYWHGCKRCYPHSQRKRQIVRDRQKAACYRKHGYSLIVIWEHDIIRDPIAAIKAVITV